MFDYLLSYLCLASYEMFAGKPYKAHEEEPSHYKFLTMIYYAISALQHLLLRIIALIQKVLRKLSTNYQITYLPNFSPCKQSLLFE